MCGDVLEHLVDPWGALAVLAGLLRPGGTAVISLPNAAHWTVRRALLRGRFPREDHGLFDRTHLRWLTLADARELVAGAGLRVVREAYTEAPLPLEARIPLPSALRAAAVRRMPQLFALQVVLVAQRGSIRLRRGSAGSEARGRPRRWSGTPADASRASRRALR